MIEEIADIVNTNTDSTKAAIKIVEYLEDLGLSLEGNGWLDDDPFWGDEEE